MWLFKKKTKKKVEKRRKLDFEIRECHSYKSIGGERMFIESVGSKTIIASNRNEEATEYFNIDGTHKSDPRKDIVAKW